MTTDASTARLSAAEPSTAELSPPRRARRARDWVLVGIGLPGAIALILFQYVPLLGNVIAFQDYQPYLRISEAPWVGLDNFSFLWQRNEAFLNALANTVTTQYPSATSPRIALVPPLLVAASSRCIAATNDTQEFAAGL